MIAHLGHSKRVGVASGQSVEVSSSKKTRDDIVLEVRITTKSLSCTMVSCRWRLIWSLRLACAKRQEVVGETVHDGFQGVLVILC